MRSVQEIFNIAIDSGWYRPEDGMCHTIAWMLGEGKITKDEHDASRYEIEDMMGSIGPLYGGLFTAIIDITDLGVTDEKLKKTCFKIYRNWGQRFKILEELQS